MKHVGQESAQLVFGNEARNDEIRGAAFAIGAEMKGRPVAGLTLDADEFAVDLEAEFAHGLFRGGGSP